MDSLLIQYLIPNKANSLIFIPHQSIGEFILTNPAMSVPKRGKIYSINEGYAKKWSKGFCVALFHAKMFAS